MSHLTETILSTLPATEAERLVVVLVQGADAGSGVHSSRMELRQQSFSNGIGWFTQSTVHLEPGQVAALRNALGTGSGQASRERNRLPREFSTIAPAAWEPKVVHADSA